MCLLGRSCFGCGGDDDYHFCLGLTFELSWLFGCFVHESFRDYVCKLSFLCDKTAMLVNTTVIKVIHQTNRFNARISLIIN